MGSGVFDEVWPLAKTVGVHQSPCGFRNKIVDKIIIVVSIVFLQRGRLAEVREAKESLGRVVNGAEHDTARATSGSRLFQHVFKRNLCKENILDAILIMLASVKFLKK